MVGEAALGAQLAIDAELQSARARWHDEEQALLAEVDALKTALAEVLDEANAKAEAARMTWQKHEAMLQVGVKLLRRPKGWQRFPDLFSRHSGKGNTPLFGLCFQSLFAVLERPR